MPSLPHLILGGIFGVCLYYISNKRFSKMHVFILFMSNLIGPDAGWVIGVGNISHSYLGAFIFAFFLTFLYHYITKFTLKIDGIKDIEVIELDDYRLSFLNTYLLVAAGCIMHIYLDGVINAGGDFTITPNVGNFEGISWSLTDLIELSKEGVINVNAIITLSIAMILYLGFVLSFVYFLKKNTIKEAAIILVHIIAFCLIFYLFGSIKATFHSDLGAIIYIGLFWLTPIILCTLSTRDFGFKKKEKQLNQEREIFKTKIYVLLYLIIGSITILEGISLIGFSDRIGLFLLESNILKSKYVSVFSIGILFVAISLIIIGSVEILLWLYIKRKPHQNKNIIWIGLWLLIMGGASLAIAFLGFFLNKVILDYIIGEYGTQIAPYFTLSEITGLIFVIVSLLFVLAIINILTSIGLIFERKKAWKFTVYYHLGISWTIIGLIIACYLSENSVKQYLKLSRLNSQ